MLSFRINNFALSKDQTSYMKKILLLLIGLNIWACQSQDSPEELSVSRDTEIVAISNAVNSLGEALVNPTKANLSAITHPELTYGHSTGTIENRSEFMEVLLTGKNDYKTFEISEQTIRVSGETAWVRHVMDASIDIPEKSIEVQLDVLTTWVKVDGKWILFARQAFKY
ncbi:MAG: hypothetical protein ACI9IP_003422 [Arcticibacterium sp.]